MIINILTIPPAVEIRIKKPNIFLKLLVKLFGWKVGTKDIGNQENWTVNILQFPSVWDERVDRLKQV